MSHLDPTMAEGIVRRTVEQSIEVKERLLEQEIPTVLRVAGILVGALRNGGKVVLFGNGGSAADAQHVAAELVNRFLMEREALPAIALTTNTSVLTSIANDAAFEEVFARQVRALVREGDVAVGISTIGDSPNVLKGVMAAKEVGATTVGFSGASGGKLRDMVDICFCAPSDHTPCIQEAHITVWHAICAVVEQELFGV